MLTPLLPSLVLNTVIELSGDFNTFTVELNAIWNQTINIDEIRSSQI